MAKFSFFSEIQLFVTSSVKSYLTSLGSVPFLSQQHPCPRLPHLPELPLRLSSSLITALLVPLS